MKIIWVASVLVASMAIAAPGGTEAYTRRGDLRVDEFGQLVNGANQQVLGNLVSQISGQPVRSMHELKARGVDRLKKKEAPRLAIRDGSRTTWVKQEDIEWIDAAGDYMCVHADGETYIMRMTMKKLEGQLDPDILQRIHRSTIVNVNCVREMQAHINGEYFLTLAGGHTVKLSRSYKDQLSFFS